MPKPDTNKNYAYISVKSLTLRPEEVTGIVGLTPDEFWYLGDASATKGRIYSFHLWRRYLEVAADVHLGAEGLSSALDQLGMDVAQRFRSVGEAGGEVVCQFVQHVHGEDDFWATGIGFSVTAIKWLSLAGARIDIDQYFGVD